MPDNREINLQEKRAYQRLPLKGKLKVKKPPDKLAIKIGGLRLLRAYLDNLSFGGLAMQAPGKLNLNEEVEFNLRTRFGKEPLIGKGKIRHITTTGKQQGAFSVGLQFTDIDKEQVIEVIKTILWHKRRPTFFQQHRKQIRLLAILIPLIFVVVWLALNLVNNISASIGKEQAEAERVRNATVYYLYHEPAP